MEILLQIEEIEKSKYATLISNLDKLFINIYTEFNNIIKNELQEYYITIPSYSIIKSEYILSCFFNTKYNILSFTINNLLVYEGARSINAIKDNVLLTIDDNICILIYELMTFLNNKIPFLFNSFSITDRGIIVNGIDVKIQSDYIKLLPTYIADNSNTNISFNDFVKTILLDLENTSIIFVFNIFCKFIQNIKLNNVEMKLSNNLVNDIVYIGFSNDTIYISNKRNLNYTLIQNSILNEYINYYINNLENISFNLNLLSLIFLSILKKMQNSDTYIIDNILKIHCANTNILELILL